jgi:drug/metabolite transporter (DMT)-like permease
MIPAPVFALASAFLYALSMPSAKLLVKDVDPLTLAGLIYLGSGIGMTCILFFRDLSHGKGSSVSSFSKRDLGWLAGVIITGGILAPVMLMTAMRLAKASTVTLLLNFEVVFTALIACFVFKEQLGLRVIIGLASILLGGISLSWTTSIDTSWSLILVLGACLFWAIDTNFAGQIAHSEPLVIAKYKSLVAGAFNLCLAFCLGYHLPGPGTISGAAAIGVVSYGIGLALFITSMRRIGAARSMAYFSTESFMGAMLSVIILREPLSINLIAAAIFMSIGVWLHLTEKREDAHVPQAA